MLSRLEQKLPFLLGLFLLVFIILRVFFSILSEDAAMTVDIHALQSWSDVFLCTNERLDWSANNHILNTIFMKLEIMIFGFHDWAVRLHCIGAFIIAFLYAQKIIQLFCSSKFREFFYLSLIFLNHYFLEFFSVGRGYGLCMAFFFMALYYFIRYAQSLTLKHLSWFFFSLFLSVWSNFSALYFLALLSVAVCWIQYSNHKKISLSKHILTNIISLVLIFAIVSVPLLKTLEYGAPIGGHNGLFQDSIVFYINQWFHFNLHLNRHLVLSSGWKLLEVLGVLGLLIFVGLQASSLFFNTQRRTKKLHWTLIYLVLGSVLIIEFVFHFLNTPFPLGRTVLLFSIPVILSVCVAYERMISKCSGSIILSISILAFLLWHFANCLNFETTMEWYGNGDGKVIARYIKTELKKSNSNLKLKLGIEQEEHNGMFFYTKYDPFIKSKLSTYYVTIDSIPAYDYLVVTKKFNEQVPKNYILEKEFKRANLYRNHSK